MKITINDDDPSYFGGSTLDNYLALMADEKCNLDIEDFAQLAKNGWFSSFLSDQEKLKWYKAIDDLLKP